MPAVCTNMELAINQWGSSYYTKNPIFTAPVSGNGFLSASAVSMCAWGDYSYPGCNASYPPEFGAYASEPYTYRTDVALTEAQAAKVLSTDYSWYGLQNIYNGMLIAGDYETVSKDYISPSAYWVETCDYYDMTSDQLERLIKFLEW